MDVCARQVAAAVLAARSGAGGGPTAVLVSLALRDALTFESVRGVVAAFRGFLDPVPELAAASLAA